MFKENVESYRLRVIEAAAQLILVEGNLMPTIAQIGRKAQVSRLAFESFKSKEILMNLVYDFALTVWKSKVEKLFDCRVSVEEHLTRFVDFSLDMSSNYPFLELFLNLKAKDSRLFAIENLEVDEQKLSSFCEELSEAMNQKRIFMMNPTHLIINLLSITDQPFKILSYRETNDDEVRNFVNHFRKETRELILRSLLLNYEAYHWKAQY